MSMPAADRDDAGGHRGGPLPARAAVEVGALALVQPAVDLPHRGLEPLGRKAAVVGQAQALLGDPGGRERALHRLALARPVFLVLGQVEHAAYPQPRERVDVVLIERVRADDQVVEHVREPV